MNDDVGITVDDLVASLKARRIRIPSEIGVFVALETSEALLAKPGDISGRDVRIAEDGTISIEATSPSASPDVSSELAAQAVVRILSSLLVAAGTGVPPALIALVEHGAGSGASALDELRAELEVSLVPLNRAAARRVLSRMTREARRVDGSLGDDDEPLRQDRLDEAVDDLVRVQSAHHSAQTPEENIAPRSPGSVRRPLEILPADEPEAARDGTRPASSAWLLALMVVGLGLATAIVLALRALSD